MTEPQTSAGHEIRHFIGLVLVVIGVLWMGASGLCSGAFFLSLFSEGGDFREALSIIPMILLIGGFSAGIGFVFYIVGRALRPRGK